MSNTGIVLLSGAGLNSSIWNEFRKEISNPVLAVDYPNRKKKDGNPNSNLTFDDYVNHIQGQISQWNNSQFIIVAHSIGACLGLKVAQHFAGKVKSFVAVGAVVPAQGHSFASSLPFPQKILMPALLTLFGTKPPDKAIAAELCNDLSTLQTEKIVSEFTPESKALYTTKISYTMPDVPRLYIKLNKDQSIPVPLQYQMARNLGAQKIEELNSGHLPMMSNPKQLASIINSFISTQKLRTS